jgi:probable addiction module antidote protein
MNKKIKVADLPTFDPAEHLTDDADIAAYLSLFIDEGDPGELAHAIGIVARVRGMAQIAEETGIGREALYKALRADSQPRFDTISRVCKALGVKLVVQPTHS